ncbi:MAG: MFS transporter [Candidatus Latescibacterota bacterium]|nr:MAG: MFS transporter [Candidatus Latescibacterota bacterium]
MFACVCHFLTHMFVLVFPAVTIPIMNTLGMPLEDVIKLSFLMYLLYGVGALPAGYIVDRWQAKRMLLIGVFAMGTGLTLAGALATARAMPVCLMLVGLGASIYHPAGLALISRTIHRRGYALGVNGVWGNLGIASAPIVTGVLTWLFGWQTAFVAMGIAALAAGFGLTVLRIDETTTDNGPRQSTERGEYLKYYVVLCAALVFAGLVYRGNMVLLPAYIELNTAFFHNLVGSLSFIEMQGSKTLAATILTSAVLVVGIFGQMIGGRAADRFDLRYSYLGVHAASVPFLIGMAFTSDYLLVLCAAMFVFFNLGMQPIENSLIAALTPTRWRSTGFAVKFVLNFGVGSAVVYLIGFVKTRYALETVYLFLAGVAFLLVSSIIGLIAATRRVPELRN